jgi:hypothetical protein
MALGLFVVLAALGLILGLVAAFKPGGLGGKAKVRIAVLGGSIWSGPTVQPCVLQSSPGDKTAPQSVSDVKKGVNKDFSKPVSTC